jgi:hypothetical protein
MTTANEDPTQGHELGGQPREDPMQGNEIGAQPSEDPMRGALGTLRPST